MSAVMAAATIAVALAAATAGWFGGPTLGVGIVLLPAALLLLRPLLPLLPKSGMGWFYAAAIVLVGIAPSLGGAGTSVRFALAATTTVLLIHVTISDRLRSCTASSSRWLRAWTAALLIALVSAALAAPAPGFGAVRLLNWVMFMPVAFLVIRRPDWRGLGTGAVISALVQMLGIGLQTVGILGGTWGGLLTSGTGYDPSKGNWLTRYTGFILDPNNLATILVLGLIACMSAFASSKSTARLHLAALAALFLIGIFASGSRGGILAAALGFLVFAFILGRRGAIWIAALVAGAAAGTLWVRWDAASKVVESISDIWDGTDTSAGLRVTLWDRYLGSADFFGIALGKGFGGYAPDIVGAQSGFDIDGEVLKQITVDNAWLKLLLESGTLGVLILAAIVLGAFAASIGARRRRQVLSGAVTACLSVIVFRSFSVDALDINPWNALIWISIGACYALRANSIRGEYSSSLSSVSSTSIRTARVMTSGIADSG